MSDDVAVATADRHDLDYYDAYPNLVAMLRGINAELEIAVQDDAFVMDIMERILSATNFDDIFEAQNSGTIAGKDFTDRPFVIRPYEDDDPKRPIRWRKSSIIGGEGLPFYAILDVTEYATGDDYTLNCGGKTFVAALRALQVKGYFRPGEDNPHGRALSLSATASESGTDYLSLRPFKRPEPSRGKSK